ncbi:MAG: 50S ribosomal protein L9 [Candidatus Marinimicrobia bacterium]|jgi:large subunit ribosomal protein L9|nr:50S ribosomal protein L9 [Candidatus Neomarinimicrobiota bacterium]MBT3518856.1 50S ribosomal protein L9 [Candidatus Neomarinimicrobiota bacterium]MBT3946446.1 50S ribosomal protein L9 [Candidatus Neomarinimicrobiota bacterium]MBT4154690.1 50S ribosomal protein L9 [Candidatus Neomarinimicrobiota bacterium]MBT4555516.1 50S ribosomal protein L9 [Candidatus Neomarinimicrobiota bacterium]
MEIILLQDVHGLGEAGDVVNVKPGYARNKLVPEGLALRASKRNLAVADERKQFEKTRKAREAAADGAMVETLSKTEITIEAQVGEEDKMFGSVTTLDIHKALKEKGITVERHAIILEEPIKALGIYHVPVRVTSELNGDVKIYVIKS